MLELVTRSLVERVVAALDSVYDPELDEPITQLRFVSAVSTNGHGDIDVRLRLPTPQCAPNFAFLMGADARAAVRAVPGVRSVVVSFEDHYTGEEINLALRDGAGFTGAFPGETGDDDLEALRAIFTRKALIGRQARLCQAMIAGGMSHAEVVGAHVADLPEGHERDRILELRRGLGLPSAGDDPAFLTPGGDPVTLDGLVRWLRGARLISLSLEANGGICRDLLSVRHGLARQLEPEGIAS